MKNDVFQEERKSVTTSSTERITVENVKRMGEYIALCAFKPFLSYADSVFGNLYKGLIIDIHRSNDTRYTFSDGYDFAQEAICFLCGHIGKTLGDVLETGRRGKVITVKIACFRTVTRSMNKLFTNRRRNVCIDNFYKLTARPELVEPQAKEDYSAVNETIKKLALTDKQKTALLCLMDEPSYSEAGRILSLNKATIWVTIKRIREKYIRLIKTVNCRP